MNKWEYQVIILNGSELAHPKAGEQLNVMGRQGWELVSAVTAPLGVGIVVNVNCVFKRELRMAELARALTNDVPVDVWDNCWNWQGRPQATR